MINCLKKGQKPVSMDNHDHIDTGFNWKFYIVLTDCQIGVTDIDKKSQKIHTLIRILSNLFL